MDIKRDEYGNIVLELDRGRFSLDIQRDDAMVKAWLYPGDHDFSEPVNLDRFALNLSLLGEPVDDDWYELPDDEIVAKIAEALDMTDEAAGLERDLRSIVDGGDRVDQAEGLYEWAAAGLTLAEVIAAWLDDDQPVSGADFLDAMALALADYRRTTGAAANRKRQEIPYCFAAADR